MTPSTLKTHTVKDLAQLAKKHGVSGWRTMRKEQLVKALSRAVGGSRGVSTPRTSVGSRPTTAARTTRSSRSPSTPRTAKGSSAKVAPTVLRASSTAKLPVAAKGRTAKVTPAKSEIVAKPVAKQSAIKTTKAVNGRKVAEATAPVRDHRVVKRIEQARARQDFNKNLATGENGKPNTNASRDRLVVMVRGPYWLHAYWELTPQGVVRAQAAMGQEWHAARPVLRLLEVSNGGTTTSSERVSRDIEIHGGVTNWYVDVKEPPQSYRLEIGYLSATGRFFSLARSNVVTTPAAGGSDTLDAHWSDVAEDCDKIFAMSGGYSPDNASTELQELFEERLRRPMGSPMITRYGVGAQALMPKDHDFEFEIDAELIIYGSTRPDAHVTLQGEPVRLRPDGSFTVRFNLPNRRQVIPAVASSRDGVEQRTIVLAVERNTKVMEPLIRDSGD